MKNIIPKNIIFLCKFFDNLGYLIRNKKLYFRNLHNVNYIFIYIKFRNYN